MQSKRKDENDVLMLKERGRWYGDPVCTQIKNTHTQKTRRSRRKRKARKRGR